MTKALLMWMASTVRAADRCNCAPCTVRVPFGVPSDGFTKNCGEIHHNVRGKSHEALRPHESHSDRRQRRKELRPKDVTQTAPEGQEE